MNEQIQKLAEQVYGSQATEQEIKFAELIVAECILTIQMGITRDGHNTEKYLRSMKHLKDIKQHFGVEE